MTALFWTDFRCLFLWGNDSPFEPDSIVPLIIGGCEAGQCQTNHDQFQRDLVRQWARAENNAKWDRVILLVPGAQPTKWNELKTRLRIYKLRRPYRGLDQPMRMSGPHLTSNAMNGMAWNAMNTIDQSERDPDNYWWQSRGRNHATKTTYSYVMILFNERETLCARSLWSFSFELVLTNYGDRERGSAYWEAEFGRENRRIEYFQHTLCLSGRAMLYFCISWFVTKRI